MKPMKEGLYQQSGNAVQMSFRYNSHELLAVTTSAAVTASAFPADQVVLLSLAVPAHVAINDDAGDAAATDMMLPAGVWPMIVHEGEYISVIQLTGGTAGQGCVIIPEDR